MEITTQLKWVRFERQDNGEVKVFGCYHLINNRGVTVAKQQFNEYSDHVQIGGFGELGKDVMSNVESTIEIQLGIQQVVRELNDANTTGGTIPF